MAELVRTPVRLESNGAGMMWNGRVSEGNRRIDRWLVVLFFVVFLIGLVVGIYQWWAVGWRF